MEEKVGGRRALETLPFDQGAVTFPKDTLATVNVSVSGPRAPDLAPQHTLTPPMQGFPKAAGPTRRMVFDICFQNVRSP